VLAMLAQETVPLLDQGSVQFILMTVMLVVVAVLIWLTIPR
jgi:hypothetical protein